LGLSSVTNNLIETLPRSARNRLLAICEPVDLVLEQTLSAAGAPSRHVYFPTGGIVSLTTSSAGTPMLEVGMVGNEGMLGTQAALGIPNASLNARVRRSGTAWRVATGPFNRELARGGALKHQLNRYLHVVIVQLTCDSGCLRFHQIGQRLARWLLMTHDRTGQKAISVTHEGIARLMGVRRVGITKAAGALQRQGIIKYVRGELKILDRKALEAEACSCYAADRKTYSRFLSSRL
jgi:CRP-like cAMP-binding protein